MDAWIYSLGYNGTYVFPDIAIAIAAGVIVLSSPAFVKQLRKFSAQKKSVPAAVEAQPVSETALPESPAQEASVQPAESVPAAPAADKKE